MTVTLASAASRHVFRSRDPVIKRFELRGLLVEIMVLRR